ncbi:hypothetical protein BO70DRAFT_127795 [Aspergillus heteromorphus CBS 117.55]|uniref:Uncharacterized protein n=1 Tax=Aspergillus heteromorphus CBS 117.55 TaxID=1448321 RepID=A0A317WZW4_9EURO|nr:uncharacterized protein BO70DRAFT_127795 [Aspergillus heteromorphus CBS 117.55]PWY89760.1 hypothetical protein BO70DRAFT_127795 [Aspergillus heteromorphus CBS 117.55]
MGKWANGQMAIAMACAPWDPQKGFKPSTSHSTCVIKVVRGRHALQPSPQNERMPCLALPCPRSSHAIYRPNLPLSLALHGQSTIQATRTEYSDGDDGVAMEATPWWWWLWW